MTNDYTMADFRAEMRRRGIYEDGHPNRWRGSRRVAARRRSTAPKPTEPAAPAAPALRAKTTKTAAPVFRAKPNNHGNAIAKIVPCGVHPLHLVNVRANGSRAGCPMCDMQIEDLCRSLASKRPAPPPRGQTPREHRPLINPERAQIVGCACGWRTPPGTTDSDDAYVEHATVAR